MTTVFYNKPNLIKFRKHLRNNSTEAERSLWKYLRNSQMNGAKFRRQYSIGSYVLDFYCVKAKLAIELDGDVHKNDFAHVRDKYRDSYIAERGIRVLRFENRIIFENLDYVLEVIKRELSEHQLFTTPSPSLARRGIYLAK